MDKEPTPLGWISESIEEVTDGASKLVPVLHSNRVGAVLFMALLVTSSVSVAIIIIAWKDPEPAKRFNHEVSRPPFIR